MKKQMLLAVSLLVTTLSVSAKVGDFNSLINENSKAQKELHQNLKQNLEVVQAEAQKSQNTPVEQSDEKYVVDRASDTVNVPTSKSFLTFTKEKKYHRPSEAQQQKRLAEELTDSQ